MEVMTGAGLLLLLCVLLPLCFISFQVHQKQSRLPPGPMPWLFLGNALQKDVLPLCNTYKKVRLPLVPFHGFNVVQRLLIFPLVENSFWGAMKVECLGGSHERHSEKSVLSRSSSYIFNFSWLVIISKLVITKSCWGNSFPSSQCSHSLKTSMAFLFFLLPFLLGIHRQSYLYISHFTPSLASPPSFFLSVSSWENSAESWLVGLANRTCAVGNIKDLVRGSIIYLSHYFLSFLDWAVAYCNPASFCGKGGGLDPELSRSYSNTISTSLTDSNRSGKILTSFCL